MSRYTIREVIEAAVIGALFTLPLFIHLID